MDSTRRKRSYFKLLGQHLLQFRMSVVEIFAQDKAVLFKLLQSTLV